MTQPTQAGLAAIVFNPRAGRGRGGEVAREAAQRLEALGFQVLSVGTEGRGHAAELAEAWAAELRRLIVIGGDGTLREAAQGLGQRAREVELGFIPMGHANVVAQELGIPLDPVRSLEIAVGGEARSLDAMRVGERLVLAMVGVGYDGQVTRWIDRARRRGLGRVWYRWHADSLYASIGALALCVPSVRFQLEVDGQLLPRSFGHLALCNMQTYAKGWVMTPGADPRDGELDYQARRRTSAPFGALALLAASRHRRVPAFVSEYGRGRRFRLSARRPFRWQADGDPMGAAKELEVQVLPAALRLLGPRA